MGISLLPGGLGCGKMFLLRAGLVKRNRMHWVNFKMATFPLLLPEAEEDFFSDLHCKNLVELLEVKLTKNRLLPLRLSPLEFLTLRFVHTEPPAIQMLF